MWKYLYLPKVYNLKFSVTRLNFKLDIQKAVNTITRIFQLIYFGGNFVLIIINGKKLCNIINCITLLLLEAENIQIRKMSMFIPAIIDVYWGNSF